MEDLRDMGADAASALLKDGKTFAMLEKSRVAPGGQALSRETILAVLQTITPLAPIILEAILRDDNYEQFVREAVERETGTWKPFTSGIAPSPLGVYGAPFPGRKEDAEE
jgi:hypothetical protein